MKLGQIIEFIRTQYKDDCEVYIYDRKNQELICDCHIDDVEDYCFERDIEEFCISLNHMITQVSIRVY